MHNRPKPRPGSLPLPKYDTADQPAPRTYTEIAEELRHHGGEAPPWAIEAARDELRRHEVERTFTALQKARAKAEELVGAARNDAFDDWVRRCTAPAKTPAEWTQAHVLYENYLAHAQRFGRNRQQRAQSVQALATETQWGRMMATLASQIPKKRRAAGWYYAIHLKRGA
ncbi:MAG: hypothetical protein IT500_11870 [Rubrivivax sp.]|nr:hypothetical protein [Rubrivivax sp.]